MISLYHDVRINLDVYQLSGDTIETFLKSYKRDFNMDTWMMDLMIKQANGRELHVARKSEKFDQDKLPCKTCLVQTMCFLGAIFEEENTVVFTLQTCKAKLDFFGIDKHDERSIDL